MSADTSLATPHESTDRLSPAATRLPRPRWSDPRLVIGLLLVVGSVVIGARLFAAAGDTTAVWAVRSDHRAGTPIETSDLRTVDVRLDAETRDRYLHADQSIEPGQVWAHSVSAGELVPVGALRSADAGDVAELPVSVTGGAMPSDLTAGDQVDVWVSRSEGSTTNADAELVLEDMRVLTVAEAATSLSEQSGRRVLLALDDGADRRLRTALGAISSGEVTLVRDVVTQTERTPS